jgi:hypothetical protein
VPRSIFVENVGVCPLAAWQTEVEGWSTGPQRGACEPPLWEASDALQTVQAHLGDTDVRTTRIDTHGLPWGRGHASGGLANGPLLGV